MSSELVLETMATDKVRPYQLNSRRNDATVLVVAESIQAYGFQQPIVIDHNDVIVAGHARWRAAKHLKLAEVPVVRFKGSDEEAKEYRILDNRSQEDSKWDPELLKQELADLDDNPTGFSQQEIENILTDLAISDTQKIEPTTFELVVDCDSEGQQKELHKYVTEELEKKCRVLTI